MVTAVPPPAGSKRTSVSMPRPSENPSRRPGSHAVMRPISRPSPVAASWTSMNRPPTRGSKRMSTVRPGSGTVLRSTTYHEPISAVNIRNASAGGRATTTVALTAPAAASTQLTRRASPRPRRGV